MPEPLRKFGTLVYIDQKWTMFAPNPSRFTGWLVVPGTLRNGTVVDLSRDGIPLSWDKPARKVLFKNERWRKYIVQYVLFKNNRIGENYAKYLCRSWNTGKNADRTLESLELDVMKRNTQPGNEQSDYTKKVLLRYNCVDETVSYMQP